MRKIPIVIERFPLRDSILKKTQDSRIVGNLVEMIIDEAITSDPSLGSRLETVTDALIRLKNDAKAVISGGVTQGVTAKSPPREISGVYIDKSVVVNEPEICNSPEEAVPKTPHTQVKSILASVHRNASPSKARQNKGITETMTGELDIDRLLDGI